MKTNCCFSAHRATFNRLCPARRTRLRRTTLCLAIATAGVLFFASPLRSIGDTLAPNTLVFLYASDGSGINVTDQVFFVDSQAYVYPDDPMEITLDYSDGHVLDPTGTNIGYMNPPPE